jgi:hypothetical protein
VRPTRPALHLPRARPLIAPILHCQAANPAFEPDDCKIGAIMGVLVGRDWGGAIMRW